MEFTEGAITKALEIAWRSTDSPFFGWLHESVRKSYILGVTPLLQQLLNRRLGPTSAVHIEIRNSTNSREYFNAFRSDLDLAIIFPPTASRESVREVIARYSVFRRKLPFLGELECYSEREWSRRKILLTEYSGTIQPVYGIRKLAWLERDLTRYRDSYHREKARQAIRKVLIENGVPASQLALGKAAFRPVLEKLASKLLAGDDLDNCGSVPEVFHSKFLEYSFGPGARNPDGITLSKGAAVVLSHLVPDGVDDAVNALVAEHGRAVAEYEWIVCQSVRRCSAVGDAGLDHWIRRLEDRAQSTFIYSDRS